MLLCGIVPQRDRVDPGLLLDELLLMVQLLMLSDPPMYWMPPPGEFVAVVVVWFPVTTQLLSVVVSGGLGLPPMMPAPPRPSASLPPLMVMSEMAIVVPDWVA